jgi:hypothetical protein
MLRRCGVYGASGRFFNQVMKPISDELIIGDDADRLAGRKAKSVTVVRNGGFEIGFSGGSIFFRCGAVNAEEAGDFNFALLALTLASMGSGQAFHLSEPVTRSALSRVRHYARILQVMKPNVFYSPVVLCPNVIEDRPPAGSESIVCLSGGVDSTYAAMIRADAFKYAMFVRGADYPLSATNILEGLEQRATTISQALGLTPIVVYSNLKDYLSQYGLQHTGFLAACLYFTGRKFTGAGWAADDPYWGELVVHPWGNNAGLAQCLSLAGRPISHIGGGVSRSEKVVEIARRHPSLFADITVCYKFRETADNCGHCEKCMRTRLNLQAIGDERTRAECETMLFGNRADLPSYVRKVRIPEDAKRLKRAVLNYQDLSIALPEGELKQCVDAHLAKLMSAGHFAKERTLLQRIFG